MIEYATLSPLNWLWRDRQRIQVLCIAQTAMEEHARDVLSEWCVVQFFGDSSRSDSAEEYL